MRDSFIHQKNIRPIRQNPQTRHNLFSIYHSKKKESGYSYQILSEIILTKYSDNITKHNFKYLVNIRDSNRKIFSIRFRFNKISNKCSGFSFGSFFSKENLF